MLLIAKHDRETGSLRAGLSVENVTVTYRNGHTALRNASFEIPTGTITALVGVNGSGKSTLFKAIMGFVPLAQGAVTILGQPAGRALKRNVVAYVPQSEDVDWNFPVLVEDVVMMGRYGHMNFLRYATGHDRDMVSAALERVGMADFRKRQIGELSGGQKKRVFLARALAQDMAQQLAKNSPQAMALSKRAIWGALEQGYAAALESGWALLRSHWSHPDFEEGPRAFAEKRDPVWNPDPHAKK